MPSISMDDEGDSSDTTFDSFFWVSEWKSLSHVQLFVTPWSIQPMEFSRPEYWSG